jgi:hypothetical protein
VAALVVVTGVAAAVVVLILVVLRPEKEVAAAIIAAAATVLGGALTVVLGRYYEKVKDQEAVTRDRKVAIYEDFIGLWFRQLYWQKTGEKEPTDRERMKWMVDFTRKATMWGSDDVIFRWGKLRSGMAGFDQSDSSRATGLFIALEQLMIAMRRDVGYPETQVGHGDLIRMYADDGLYEAIMTARR